MLFLSLMPANKILFIINYRFDNYEKHEECIVCCLIILSINYNKKMASYVIYTIHSKIHIYVRRHLI